MTEPTLSRRDQALLVRLADDTLTTRDRRRAERLVGALPDAERIVERQRRVARALEADAPPPAAGRARGPLLAPRLAIAGAVSGALACVLVVLAVVLSTGERAPVWAAADLAKQPATQPAPAEDGALLDAAVDGVRFPDWGAEFGWHETGMRRDEIAGRPTTTVFYEHTTHRLAYTIVPGPALPRPDGARIVRRDGLEIALYRDEGHGGHDVAVFERDGRTCVLAGHVIEVDTIVELAAWTGGGRVRS